MCGIAGFINNKHLNNKDELLLDKMLSKIIHRGPDSFGIWHENDVFLGHRRLAILDLSPAGHQPMLSKDQNLIITFNGEIYNYLDIKHELDLNKNIHWVGHSDTEVILEAISFWGLEKALNKFNGMFAFALWNKKTQELVLARDRFGEKPLYYSLNNGSLIFASELIAIEQYPNLNTELDHEAIQLYLKYRSIPAPYSIYKSVKKLNPGSYACWNKGSSSIEIKNYWDAKKIFIEKSSSPIQICEADALNKLDSLLHLSVQNRMISDVSLGSFLSGGFDSSLITAIMQKNSSTPVTTFSIGFDNPAFNEAEHAKEIAFYLGTNHIESYVTGSDALNVVTKLADIYDEPFADSSQIPMYLLSMETKKHVTVSLSGDGGDELFGGYTRYINSLEQWEKLKSIPLSAHIFRFIAALPDYLKGYLLNILNLISQRKLTELQFKDLIELYSAKTFSDFYQILLSSWKNTSVLLNNPDVIQNSNNINLNQTNLMMLEDTLNYLPNDILTKVDRACMSVSLEGRIPFLDKDIAEFAWSLPLELKINNRMGKYLPKVLAYNYIPKHLLDRPKTGFAVPLAEWLRNDLKDWASNLLANDKLIRHQIFDARIVSEVWSEHQSGLVDHSDKLWTILMLQSWLVKREL